MFYKEVNHYLSETNREIKINATKIVVNYQLLQDNFMMSFGEMKILKIRKCMCWL